MMTTDLVELLDFEACRILEVEEADWLHFANIPRIIKASFSPVTFSPSCLPSTSFFRHIAMSIVILSFIFCSSLPSHLVHISTKKCHYGERKKMHNACLVTVECCRLRWDKMTMHHSCCRRRICVLNQSLTLDFYSPDFSNPQSQASPPPERHNFVIYKYLSGENNTFHGSRHCFRRVTSNARSSTKKSLFGIIKTL